MARASKTTRRARSTREQQKVRFLLQDFEPQPLGQPDAAMMASPSLSPAPNQLNSRQQAEFEDAISYVGQVKSRFEDQPDVYHRFLDTLDDRQSQSIELIQVIVRVKKLFHGHPDLIQGFAAFLHCGSIMDSDVVEDQAVEDQAVEDQAVEDQAVEHQTVEHQAVEEHFIENHTVEDPKAVQTPDWSGALNFLDEVISRFQDMPDVKDTFLTIMHDWKVQDTRIPTLVARVLDLFHTQHDLVREFNVFLPPGHIIECGLVEDPKAFRLTKPDGTTAWSLRDASGDHFFIGR